MIEEEGDDLREDEAFIIGELHPDFKQFIQKNGIPLDAFQLTQLSRFFRINPQKPISEEELCKQLEKENLEPVAWLPQFFKLPAKAEVASLSAYKQGHIYGIDVSSGAVIKALSPQLNDNVLDFCCAPGNTNF